MDEGFPDETVAVAVGESEKVRAARWTPLSQWRVLSAAGPPRTISNRVVKRRSAEGTGGMSAGRAGPRAIPTGLQIGDWRLYNLQSAISNLQSSGAAWSSGSSSGS